jgi:CheY-specific phosphatase CheX
MSSTEAILDTHPEALAVRGALESTFAMFSGCEPTYRGSSAEKESGSHIIGVISLFGDRARSLMLCLPGETATAIAMKFCGFEVPFDSRDMADVVGELINILAGSVIARFESIGVKAEMSLPTVVRGTDIDLPVPDGLQILRMSFEAPEGPFLLNLLAGEAHTVLSKGK